MIFIMRMGLHNELVKLEKLVLDLGLSFVDLGGSYVIACRLAEELCL